jgi:hypothetical protein
MKTESKNKMLYWGVKVQIQSRPTKNARGMAFTNERRARQEGKSFFYHAILTDRKQTHEARSLSVKGTLDKLASVNSVKIYNVKRYRKGLPQQKAGKNPYSYLKELAV